jgi:ABC-2 type transport system permease protein
MAGMTGNTRDQYAAIARLRWNIFRNAIRSRRGKANLVSQIIMGIVFGLFGLGGSIGMGTGAWYLMSENKGEWLAALFWPVLLFWQFFPIMATAFTENLESSNLLRFPLTYRSYFLIRLAYGLFDPATSVCCLWLLGIGVGITVAHPALLPWVAVVLLAFAGFNILLTRTIFSWVERWLAQRRTREIFGILLFLITIGFQFIGPAIERFSRKPVPGLIHNAERISVIQRALPPGLAATSIAYVEAGQLPRGLIRVAELCAYAAVLVWLLNFRLHAQYRGENLSEAEGSKAQTGAQQLHLGWKLPGISGPISAVFEKDFRILSRSGPILLTMVMPVAALFILRVGHWHAGSQALPSVMLQPKDFGFPVGAAYSLLMFTNLVNNNFGGEGMGVQFYLVSPVRFREIVLGKNLVHGVFLVTSLVLVWLAVNLVYGPPALAIIVMTLSALLFAAPVNFAGGNLFSLYSPKRVDYGTFGRQKASQLTVLASLGIQILISGLGAGAVFVARLYGNLWLATPVFLFLAVFGIAGYLLVLGRVDKIALKQRETLVTELGKS